MSIPERSDKTGLEKESHLLVSIFLNAVITAVQVIGGIASGSLAILSDALHNFSDVVSLIISFIAVRLSKQANTEASTFGFKRAEIIAALFNASALIMIAFFLFKEAGRRFFETPQINSPLMMIIAGIALAANLLSALLLKKDASSDMNMRSAYFHLMSDAISSLAVIAAGALIFYFKVYWVDPLLTIFIGLYILKGGGDLVMESLHILMQNTPRCIRIKDIQRDVESMEQVRDIHHVHAWAVTERDIYFEAHINLAADMSVSQSVMVRNQIERLLRDKFGIGHVTLQIEYGGCMENGVVRCYQPA